jgi:leucyl aminopeptidase
MGHHVAKITLQSGPAAEIAADALVFGIYQGEDGVVLTPAGASVHAALAGPAGPGGGGLAAALKALGASGAADEVTRIPSLGALAAPVVVALGLGEAGNGEVVGSAGLEDLRRAAGAAARALAGFERVAFLTSVTAPEVIEATALGAALGAYTATGVKSAEADSQKAPISEVILASEAELGAEAEAAVRRAQVLADAVYAARDLVNLPPSHLFPQAFAQHAQDAVENALKNGASGLDFEVLDEEALRAGGYGGIVGVGQGSTRPPRLVRIAYRHPDAERTLAFVGKGITFDSGGISLKPPASMMTMKSDMAGAAAVVNATLAIARLGLPVNVTAWAALAENMPGGGAIRPSDVLTMYGGKTVEVLNTDAEGRLVLGDALVRASEEDPQPQAIIDVATLTGAQIAALGMRTAGVMANDEEFRVQIESAAERAGEDVWPMPLPGYLRKSLDSESADLANIGESTGGMLVAGLFLKEFVADGIAWAHIDIAGPSYHTGTPYGYTPKGGTGFTLRTLVQVAQDAADGLL